MTMTQEGLALAPQITLHMRHPEARAQAQHGQAEGHSPWFFTFSHYDQVGLQVTGTNPYLELQVMTEPLFKGENVGGGQSQDTCRPMVQ